jgi:hypothetical protein
MNLDLGIAASKTMDGKDLYGVKKEFSQINAILCELIDGANTSISTVSPIFGWLNPLAKGKDQVLLSFPIQLVSDDVWKFDSEYHFDPDKSLQIKGRNISISGLTEKLINSCKLIFLVKIIAAAK